MTLSGFGNIHRQFYPINRRTYNAAGVAASFAKLSFIQVSFNGYKTDVKNSTFVLI